MTLLLTPVRVLDPSLQEQPGRPFVTPMTINGKALMEATNAKKQASLLTEWVKPLVKTLLITERSNLELDFEPEDPMFFSLSAKRFVRRKRNKMKPKSL
jgi:hypothetical protein